MVPLNIIASFDAIPAPIASQTAAAVGIWLLVDPAPIEVTAATHVGTPPVDTSSSPAVPAVVGA